MCKIILIPNASKIKNIEEFSKFTAKVMEDMGDGFGYVAQGKKGLFGVRTLSPKQYASNVESPKFCIETTQHFGKLDKVVGAAMFHGRLSTNTINFNNTHPIQRDNWSMIHNGVVTHHGDKYQMNTSNDSEHVLYNLINGGIDKVSENLTGYYACGAISPDGLFHVFRDSIAQLYYTYSKTIDSPIFATNEDILTKIGTFLKEELVSQKVKDNTYLVFKGKELVKHTEFKSRGLDTYSKNLSHISLGESMTNDESYHYDDPINWENISNEYLDEYEYFDDSYQFHYGFKEISCDEFFKLEFSDQLQCKILRYDNSIVEKYSNEESEKIISMKGRR